jgi:hypothetical protein
MPNGGDATDHDDEAGLAVLDGVVLRYGRHTRL